MADQEQPVAEGENPEEVTGTSEEAKGTDGAAPAEQPVEDSPTSDPQPVEAEDNFDIDVTTGYKAMADRRRAQLKERHDELHNLQAQLAEREQALAQRDMQLARIQQAAPYWMKEIRTKKQLEQQIEQLKARGQQYENLLKRAREEGWEGADELERHGELDQIKSQIDKLTQLIERSPTEPPQQFGQPTDYGMAPGQQMPGQYQQPYGYQPQQQQFYEQPQQPQWSEDQQRQQAFNYFRAEFANLVEASGMDELKGREQNVLDRWWRAGGSLSVDDAMQDDLEYVFEKRKSRVQRKAAQHSAIPGVPGSDQRPSGGDRFPAAAGQPDGIRRPTSASDKPRGISDVAKDHREGRLKAFKR